MIDKKIFGTLFFILALAGCGDADYSADKVLSSEERQLLIAKIVRYTAKLPPTASQENKFSPEFDEYYNAVATDYDIRLYHFDSNDTMHYILATRAARSIKPMRESIGIKVKYDNTGGFSWYEEIFRTWKMPEDRMVERYPVLFDLMVKGESLEPYYPKHKGDEYIEFPDGRFYFDTNRRTWRDQLFDSLGVRTEFN